MMLSKISQSEKDKYPMISVILESNEQTGNRSVVKGNRLTAVRGGGWGTG